MTNKFQNFLKGEGIEHTATLRHASVAKTTADRALVTKGVWTILLNPLWINTIRL